ncbi:hypothetical protein EVAR_48170_1 [Eumeta japonica]|uniref:Uncharacterized protein n=1 Tax=Eumeta variegata TaxID=151549 RepID=A0A4C1WPW2_EUMVA|nr:hypothetical protein EVAR_48170_1 [Eumeta japonica]
MAESIMLVYLLEGREAYWATFKDEDQDRDRDGRSIISQYKRCRKPFYVHKGTKAITDYNENYESPLLPPSDILCRIYIVTQEVDNTLVTPPKWRVSLGSGDSVSPATSYLNAKRLQAAGRVLQNRRVYLHGIKRGLCRTPGRPRAVFYDFEDVVPVNVPDPYNAVSAVKGENDSSTANQEKIIRRSVISCGDYESYKNKCFQLSESVYDSPALVPPLPSRVDDWCSPVLVSAPKFTLETDSGISIKMRSRIHSNQTRLPTQGKP